jgi:hypothetical protein
MRRLGNGPPVRTDQLRLSAPYIMIFGDFHVNGRLSWNGHERPEVRLPERRRGPDRAWHRSKQGREPAGRELPPAHLPKGGPQMRRHITTLDK